MHRMNIRRAGLLMVLFPILLPGCGPRPPEAMVLVPAGPFLMGTHETDLEDIAEELGITKPWVRDATPMHEIDLPAFFIDRYEVTNREYFRFVQARGFSVLPHWQASRPTPGQEVLPVIFVNWFEADAYCRSLGKRLPTEAEWEKAARGTQGWIYPWGYFFDRRRANIGGIRSGPLPGGSFPRGGGPYGAYDLIGNVWEWMDDWYGPYPGSAYDSSFYGDRYRVARGNSWAGLGHFEDDILEQVRSAQARATYRMYFLPHIALEDVGFRCAMSVTGLTTDEASPGTPN